MQDIERYVSELSEAVWEQTVGLPLIPADVSHDAGTRIFEGHVHIFGPWTGTLVLQCSHGAAVRAAEAFFESADSDNPQNPQDAVCELTNMIGGNLKALMAEEGCSLSLPTVIEGVDYVVRIPHTRQVARRSFMAGDEPVVVTLLEPHDDQVG
jgi:chemotaxis protein CheX